MTKTKLFRNKLLEDVVGLCAKVNKWPEDQSLGSRSHFYPESMRGYAGGHGSCYGQIPSWNKEKWIYFPPAYQSGSPTLATVSMNDRIWYAKMNYFHPNSPWRHFLPFLDEMFEGYETDDEKAELIARYGFVLTRKMFDNMPMSHIGSFLIFWRKAHENKFVIPTFKYLMETKPHSKRPYRWNLIISTFIQRYEGGKIPNAVGWDGGHHMLQPSTHPQGLIGFLVNELTPDFNRASYWEGHLNGLWSPGAPTLKAWTMPNAEYIPNGWNVAPQWADFDNLVNWYWDNRVKDLV